MQNSKASLIRSDDLPSSCLLTRCGTLKPLYFAALYLRFESDRDLSGVNLAERAPGFPRLSRSNNLVPRTTCKVSVPTPEKEMAQLASDIGRRRQS